VLHERSVLKEEEPTPDSHDAGEDEATAEDEERPFVDEEEQQQTHSPERETTLNPWTLITTGRILPKGSLRFHRLFIAIAVMCFISIFLTFMSLNASREYRKREQYASVLHERSVLKEEERYELSSKPAVTKRLKDHGIELIDLTKNSRLIEK
jgi:hypothetical protein